MNFLGPFHPQIVHTPIALLIFSAFFAIAGRLLDREWLRKTSVLLLVIGFVGSFLAEQSGKPAHRVPEHDQGVPEEAIHEHSDAAKWVTWTSGGAVAAVAVASRLKGGAAGAVGGLALVLQVMAAVAVTRTGLLGGKLTYEHGANVKVDGQLVKSARAGEHREERSGSREAPAEAPPAQPAPSGGSN
jgi:uncharacterized membrane protein